MKKVFKRKIAVAAVIITLAVALVGLLFGNNNFAVSGVRTVFIPVLTLFSDGLSELKNLQTYFADVQSYKEQNTALAKEVAELKRTGQSGAEYKEQITRLEELLDLKGDMEDSFTVTAAKVVSYTPNNWFDTIVINKGEWSGISEGDAVVSTSGVVGKVKETGAGYSVISTILSSENSVAVRVVRNGMLAVAEGDAVLSSEKLCKMSFVENSSDVNLGDLVETTGAGGVYPEGVTVGTVKEIKTVNAEEYVVIQPAVDMTDLYEVLVLSNDGE